MKRTLKPGICLGVFILAFAATSLAQQAGTCSWGKSEAFLDANQVRASIYNSGNLFTPGFNNPNSYVVPKHGLAKAIFMSNLWIGGHVGGELRFSGSDYGPPQFFPGPLTESGELPNPSDCSEYDRIYEVTVRDLERLDETGEATADIRDWPWELGAPVEDGDGNPDNYDLDGGDRPEITGHQMLWWIMNDLGGPQTWGKVPALGLEIQVSAFAVLGAGTALDHTTFYRYRITNKQSYTVDSTYFGFWLDVHLGNPSDDYSGSDTTLGMAFFYNRDNDDESLSLAPGYGIAPPALGFDFVQGPRVDNATRTTTTTARRMSRANVAVYPYFLTITVTARRWGIRSAPTRRTITCAASGETGSRSPWAERVMGAIGPRRSCIRAILSLYPFGRS